MELEKYISSGILELYVYGALPEEESLKVTQELKQHPEILKEVEEIEAALTQLSISVAPYNPEALLYTIQQKITENTPNFSGSAFGRSTSLPAPHTAPLFPAPPMRPRRPFVCAPVHRQAAMRGQQPARPRSSTRPHVLVLLLGAKGLLRGHIARIKSFKTQSCLQGPANHFDF